MNEAPKVLLEIFTFCSKRNDFTYIFPRFEWKWKWTVHPTLEEYIQPYPTYFWLRDMKEEGLFFKYVKGRLNLRWLHFLYIVKKGY